MANETEITVKGWIGQHPKMSVTRSGGTMARLRVGSTPRRRDAVTGQWGDAPTSWFSVLVFGDLADNVARSLRKGDPVLVRGRYSLKRSEYQGKEHTEAEIVADAIGPELGYGTALYAPMVRRGRGADDDAEPSGLADLSFAVDLDDERPGDLDEIELDDDLIRGEPDDGPGLPAAGSEELVGTP